MQRRLLGPLTALAALAALPAVAWRRWIRPGAGQGGGWGRTDQAVRPAARRGRAPLLRAWSSRLNSRAGAPTGPTRSRCCRRPDVPGGAQRSDGAVVNTQGLVQQRLW